MKTKILLILAQAFAELFTFDKENGVIFSKKEDIYVFDASAPTQVPIMFASPYHQFREDAQADCGNPGNGIIPKEKNFFDLKAEDKAMESISEHCETAFRVFDDILLDMIGADLLFTDAYERKLDDMVNQRRMAAFKQRNPRSTTTLARRPRRKKRAIGVATAAGVTVAATGISLAYTGYVDAKSKQRDEELQYQIDDSRRAIAELSQSFELNTEMIGELAKQIKKSQSPIIVRGGIQISNGEIMQKDVLDGNPQSIIEYFAAYSSNYAKEMVQSLLTLTNHRLPLYGTYIDTIRANCLAVQTIDDEKVKDEFCLGFAYHSTRWDTDLRYMGVGITTFDQSENANMTTQRSHHQLAHPNPATTIKSREISGNQSRLFPGCSNKKKTGHSSISRQNALFGSPIDESGAMSSIFTNLCL